MSLRRRLDELEEPPDEDVPLEDELDEEDVEYFVDEPELDESVRTSVPKSEQLSQRSSSAPSTLVVVSDEF